MPAPPFADAEPPQATPGGDGATSAFDPRSTSGTAPSAALGAARSAKGDEELEHGWTGLGLPAYEENPAPPPPAPVDSPSPKVEAPSPKVEAPSPKVEAPSPKVEAPSPVDSPSPKVEAPMVGVSASTPNLAGALPKIEKATKTPMPATAPPVAKPPPPAPRPAMGPPRPTGRSGSFPAAPRLPKPVADPARTSTPSPEPNRLSVPANEPARVSTPAPEPSRLSAPSPEPGRLSTPAGEPARHSAPAPEAAPRAAAAAPESPRLAPSEAAPRAAAAAPEPPRVAPPEPAPRAFAPEPSTSATGTLRDPIRIDALGPELLGPPPSERDITVEDEGDLGATIPETSLPFDDLTATVPNLPPPAHAPSFGLPPPVNASASGAHPAAPPAIAAPRGNPAPADLAEPADTGPPPYGEGALIGEKYRLIRVIGRGGMGAVWVAHNTALDVDVAIKLMRRDRATPEAAARFTTEARAAARLGHPSIVRVFDFGETSRGDPFIVMELLHGESFGALLARKKKLSPTVAVQTLLPVAHALAAAHSKGIVHRDLKPDNILLAKDETNVVTPKVVDFGIAKLSSDVDRHFTIAGEVLGSPDYMSPEQARGEDDIDHRSDIWTFSVLLYEAISGKRPFDGANYNALLAAIIASRPASFMELGVADPGLWSIVEKGLHKERDGRWQSVREMGMELARWAIDHGAEHDLLGTSLAAQWLEPTRKRLFTVAGSPPPENAATPAPNVTIPKPPPLGNLAAEVAKPTGPATATTLPPFVPRRRPWVAIAAIAVVVGGATYGLVRSGAFDPSPSPGVPSTSATVSAAPSETSPPPSTTTSSAAAPIPSVRATTSAKARPSSTPAPTTKGRAPQVKGDIKF